MKILLTDGSGLTARQSATRLAAAGHEVAVLAPDPLCLCRFTRHVRRIHRVPPYGADPVAWLDAAEGYDVLFPTQEQVAVLAAVPDRLRAAGVATAVPPFAALAAVQDKISAFATLTRLGLPQPVGSVASADWERFPAYVKEPIGTASGGVVRVRSAAELRAAADGRIVLVQEAVDGPLAMCQAVFAHGTLVALHANLRTGEGANGGASHKRSVELPVARKALDSLGTELGWHGALSADVIVGPDGPLVIDVNPRLVEPENGWRSGVDLVGALLAVAVDSDPAAAPPGRPGVATHQLLLAVLGAAQGGGGRRAVARELIDALARRGAYRGSAEELTPTRGDRRAALPVLAAAAATLARPSTAAFFTSGSVENYALSPAGWDDIRALSGVVLPTSAR
jgi:glutathione synthase/RimK-type ligase-like ATP-grasp enzyme